VLFILLVAIGGFDSSVFNRVALTVIALGFELLAWLAAGTAGVVILAVHLVSILGFPFLVGALEGLWLKSERKKREAEVQSLMKRAEREADEYRFSGMTSVGTEMPVEKRSKDLQRSSVKQLGITVNNILKVLDTALRPYTAAVYWLSVDETTVSLMDAMTSSDLRLRNSMESGEGVVGAILKGKKTVLRNNLTKAERLFTYYPEKVPLKSFVGVPLLESSPDSSDGREYLRGVLLADRHVDVPFGEDDERLMQVCAKEIVRIWKTERQLNRMDKIRNEASGLYDATEGLIKAISLQEVVDEVLASLAEIFKGADFTAVVLQEDEGRSMAIKAVKASDKFESWADDHLNQEIARGNHLCSLVMRKGMILPDLAFDKRTRSQRKLFGEKHDPPGLRSVKVAPLKTGAPEEESAMGVLVVGSSKPAFFHERGVRSEDVKRTLETFSNIAAISIQNARRYQLLEQLATTDPLTGLHNRRRFFEMLDEAVADAKRYNRPLSLIMTDIDHFKVVNDTYGHPVGDEVLKRVARVLSDLARTTDRVCRIGGEEFTVILPETDRNGGWMLAERFRTEIKKQEFESQGRKFGVTLSLGICTMPGLARHDQELLHRSDQALYHAKNHGRDQSIHYADIAQLPVAESHS
jgi:diguanylate cyclase (GGDEF)-like protein